VFIKGVVVVESTLNVVIDVVVGLVELDAAKDAIDES
jgi:hypothetical protein